MKILIADDSLLVCERLAEMLKKIKGVEIVGETHDVCEIINSIQSKRPEIVILDSQVQGEKGIDVVQKIKKEQTTPILIMLTNHPYPQYRKRCMEVGADYFFDKSFEFEKITDVVNHRN